MKTYLSALFLISACTAFCDGLDDSIKAEMAHERVPGLSFAVLQHGKIVRKGAYGYADLEWGTKTTNDTKYEMASSSKMIAGAATRVALDQGLISLDDPIEKFFPNVPAAWHGMQIKHLNTMSSGLPEDFSTELIPYNKDVVFPDDDASTLQEFMGLKLVAPIGERFNYSSPNTHMLGMIIAKVSEMSYGNFVRKFVFEPAGMSDSSIIDNAEVVRHKAQGYRLENGVIRHGRYLGQYLHSRADDAILSTPTDYAKFILALQDGKIVKDPSSVWQETVTDSGRPLDYAYGWIQDTHLGHRRQEHPGGYRTGFHAFVARYPDDDLSVVVCTNCDFSAIRNYANMISRHFLTDLPDPAAESALKDDDAAETQRLAAVLSGLAKGEVDSSAMEPNAIEPLGIDEIHDFLKDAGPFTFAGRRRIKGDGMMWHNVRLIDFEILKTTVGGEVYYLTLYREPSGKVGLVEETN